MISWYKLNGALQILYFYIFIDNKHLFKGSNHIPNSHKEGTSFNI